MSNELNDYLESKGVTTNLKHKRQLAKAFGLPMTTGTDEEESGLLLAFKVGAMANQGTVTESFKVEAFNFDEKEVKEFATEKQASDSQVEMEQQGWRCRFSKVTTIIEKL